MPKFATRICCFGPPFISCAAFILSIFANARCYLVNLDSDNALRQFFPEPQAVGLWCYEARNGNNYKINDSLNFDSKFDAARGLGTATLSLGLVVWVYFLFVPCVRPLGQPCVIAFIAFLCFCTCLFQGLVFLIFKSDAVCAGENRGCSLGTGGNCAIAACVLWFLSTLMTYGTAQEVKAAQQAGGASGVEDAEDAAED